MAKPHVAVLATHAALGGAERSLLELVAHCRDELAVTILAPGEGPLVGEAARAGARAQVVAWPDPLLALGERAGGRPALSRLVPAMAAVPAVVARLRATLAALAPNVLVTNGIKAHVLGALARRPGTAVVWYGREGLEGRALSPRVLRLTARRCDRAIAISRYVGGELARVLPRRVPVHVVPNLVDARVFRPGLPPPADLAKPDGEVWLGVVGALTPLKGQDVFLRAAARVAGAVPAARFLVVGGNSYASERELGFEARLRNQAAALALGERVRFLGERADVAAIVANLDVLVQPNRGPEGLGRVVLEAMAAAVPVVAVDRWGPAELVRHGETGLLVPPADDRVLADRMTMLAERPDLRRRLGRAGRRRFDEEFSAAVIVPRFLDALGMPAPGATSRRAAVLPARRTAAGAS